MSANLLSTSSPAPANFSHSQRDSTSPARLSEVLNVRKGVKLNKYDANNNGGRLPANQAGDSIDWHDCLWGYDDDDDDDERRVGAPAKVLPVQRLAYYCWLA